MALTTTEINSDTFTKVATGSKVTFQNQGEYDILIAYSDVDVQPTPDSGGMAYAKHQGELQQNLNDLSLIAGANFVWAKSTQFSGVVVSEVVA